MKAPRGAGPQEETYGVPWQRSGVRGKSLHPACIPRPGQPRLAPFLALSPERAFEVMEVLRAAGLIGQLAHGEERSVSVAFVKVGSEERVTCVEIVRSQEEISLELTSRFGPPHLRQDRGTPVLLEKRAGLGILAPPSTQGGQRKPTSALPLRFARQLFLEELPVTLLRPQQK